MLADLNQLPEAGLLAEERALLGLVREALVTAEASSEDLALLRQAIADLDTLFLLVVVGEFNAGKSAFINALLGQRVLPEGVTPTTAAITWLRYGEGPAEHRLDDLVEYTYPDPLLRTVAIVDTPGTNAVLREHEALTERIVPRADLILFVTSADRPFTESERAFMARIRAWGKRLVLILNKADLLHSRTELDAQLAFVREQAHRLLGFVPEIFPISARQALTAKLAGSAPVPATRETPLPGVAPAATVQGEAPPLDATASFAALERYLRETLDDRERLRLKLLSPLGVAERLVGQYAAGATGRAATLRGDLQLSEQLAAQLELYRADLERDFTYRLHAVDNLLHELDQRGRAFFENTLRLGRIFDLFNRDRIRAEFEAQVIADTPERIDRAAQDLIEWLVDQDERLWESIRQQIEQRQAIHPLGTPAERPLSGVERDRRALLGGIAATAREVVLRHDHPREAEELAVAVRTAVTQATLLEAGAIGFGALTLALVGSAAADVTGLLASSVIAGLGLYVLPLQKRRVTQRFHERTEQLRTALDRALRDAFAREVDRALDRIRGALAPYDRFARVEYERAARLAETLETRRAELAALRARIEHRAA
ncbi:MAG: dynamin family protein [Chloroflexi bacterium]|nr:dynamin family protein [Chloroflexota bacterium]